MKKLIIVLAVLATIAVADIRGEFAEVVEKRNCRVERWLENDYESGVRWRHYAKVVCADTERMPSRIAGLKFLDVSMNLKGEYVYTYGED